MLSIYFHPPKPNCLVKLLTCSACKNAIRYCSGEGKHAAGHMAWNKLYCLHFLQLWIDRCFRPVRPCHWKEDLSRCQQPKWDLSNCDRVCRSCSGPPTFNVCASLCLPWTSSCFNFTCQSCPNCLFLFWISESKCFQCLEATWLCQPLVSCLCENCTQTGQKGCIVHWGHYGALCWCETAIR